jgi:hypothetical protein
MDDGIARISPIVLFAKPWGRVTMRASHSLAVAILIATSPCASAQDSVAWDAASSVKGSIETEFATLRLCQEIDGPNVGMYRRAMAAFIHTNTDAINLADKVMRDEMLRAGKSLDDLDEEKQRIKTVAADAAKSIRTGGPEAFLANCRFVSEQYPGSFGIFAPLRQQFPRQMHILERQPP